MSKIAELKSQLYPSRRDTSDRGIRHRRYIGRGLSDIRPEDLLPILCAQWPARCELFSTIVADCELWRIYREKAAEVFCKEDGRYFLECTPAFPLYFLCIDAGTNYHGQSKWLEQLHMNSVSLGDLVEIAERLILENR